MSRDAICPALPCCFSFSNVFTNSIVEKSREMGYLLFSQTGVALLFQLMSKLYECTSMICLIMSQQGQKIWTITPDNLELALSKINLGDEAEADIRNAVNAWKIATAHENRINFNGWIGEGDTLIDPQTGAGAYMISGGGNGGWLSLVAVAAIAIATILGTSLAILTAPMPYVVISCGYSNRHIGRTYCWIRL